MKIIFKLRGNRDREELDHYAVLTMPVEELSHVQYSTLPSVEWQQRGRKHATVRQFNTLEILSTKGLYRKRTMKGVSDPSNNPACLPYKFRTPNYIST